MPKVHLLIRPEPKRWERTLLGVYMVAGLGVVFFLIVARGSGNARWQGWAFALLALWLLVAVGSALWGVAVRIWRPPQVLPLWGLALDEQVIGSPEGTWAVAELRSVVIESDGYAGQPSIGRRTPITGRGQLTITSTTGQEQHWLIIIRSAADMKQLRQLTAHWRSQGKTALMMD